MANPNLLTYGAKVSNIELDYYAPVVVLPSALTVPLGTTYCFIAKPDPWPVDANPPVPTQDQKSIKQIFKTIFAVKLIQTSNISPVIQRIDWTSGGVYDYYDDSVDMFALTGQSLNKRFYVKNRFDQVFKCLWNNNGGPSTKEPYFEPGVFTDNNMYQSTDGYKWKYMYTIDTNAKLKFMDASWMPVPVGQNTPNPLQTAAGSGSIDAINITNVGTGYNSGNVITVQVTGDGTGATAVAGALSGTGITDIIVTNPGKNYSYANVIISSTSGSGAVAIAPCSPVGGHGFDPISELGCSHIMYSIEFNGTDAVNGVDMIPTDITYHQIGLLVNPVTSDSAPNPANSSIYKTTTDVVVASGFGTYTSDELVYQGASLADAYLNGFVGTLLSFDSSKNLAKLINTSGTLNLNAGLVGVTSATTRTVLNVQTPKFVLSSGYIIFVENRPGIQRSVDGIEQFKIVIGY